MSLPWQYSEPLGGDYLYNPRTDEIILRNGTRLARPPYVPRDLLQRAAYDGPLPGYQPQHDRQNQGYQLQQGLGPGQAPLHQAQNAGALRGGHPQAAGRGRGQLPGPGQVQPRTQPGGSGMNQLTQSMANTSLAPGASNSAASPVQTRRIQQNGAELEQSVDPRTGVQVIIQNAPPTPRNLQAEGIVLQRSLVGTGGNAERLFPDYVVRSSRFFCLGRVFLVLWAEPAGGNAGTVVTMQERGTVRNHLGELVFSKARSDERPSREETAMRPESIRVDPDNQTDRLDPMSRIDFGGVHQVQHNIKTKSLGIVSRQSVNALQSQFANVWHDQLRRRSRPAAGHSQAQGAQHAAAVAGAVGVASFGVGAFGTANAPTHDFEDDDEEEENEDDDDEAADDDEDDDSEDE
ncbi:hypothetical protein Q7P35_005114 [Cladosporium inversicolor]